MKVFAPAYLGGWTACEHWGLTEQVFSDLVVFTRRNVRNTRQTIQGTIFVLRVVPGEKMFGLKAVWRGQVTVQLSDPTRTIVDILNEPALGGGVRHAAQVLVEYFAGQHRDDRLLAAMVRRLGNRTVAKRLGYVVEKCGIRAPELVAFCRKYMSTGYSKLDPDGRVGGRYVRRWNLQVNATLAPDE